MATDLDDNPASCGLQRIAILGTLPPLRAISSYCGGLVEGLVQVTDVEFISFSHLYPKVLYPGAALEDPDSQAPQHPRLYVRRTLAWFNPFSWISAALRLRSRVAVLQWWSLPLAPVYLIFAVTARMRGIRVVTTLHNITPHSGRSLPYRLATRAILTLSDRAIVHSARNARQLSIELGYRSDRILTLPMGAADFRRGRSIDLAVSRERLSLPVDRQILLMFGSLRGYKGLEHALKAMRLVARDRPRTLLLVAGQPWQPEARYHEQVERLGLQDQVRFDLNFIADEAIHDYFSAADLLLLPYTHFDAQSGVGISALPYGLPMIVTDCGSLPELVLDRDSIVEPGNFGQLANRISAVLSSSDLSRSLADDALFLAESHRWSTIARILCEHLARLQPEGAEAVAR